MREWPRARASLLLHNLHYYKSYHYYFDLKIVFCIIFILPLVTFHAVVEIYLQIFYSSKVLFSF